ncbi:hypothetical protein [Stutzerimonas azotifigens]|uniref:hypothetical protein n=1 Tax=Stutzerimonas azotifigens TaxID=291995 RepID=UPI0004070FBF|nr:hypothetical protein [Stutzerimonas azotifigens]
MIPSIARPGSPARRPLSPFAYRCVGDASPLNDLDESEHENEELPDEKDLTEVIEQVDEPMPMVSDPSQP